MPRRRTMDPRVLAFVDEYLKDFNAGAAALRVGYAESGARQQGYKLLKRTDVQELLRQKMEARAKRVGITSDRVLEELALLCFSDVRWFAFRRGKVVLTEHAPAEATRVLQALDGEKRRFKLHDKNSALEKAMRHLGMLTDRLRIPGKGDVPIPAGATIVVNFPDNGRRRSA